MSAPLPFVVAQQAGNRFAAANTKRKDASAIDQILEHASKTGKSEDIDLAMRQILSRVSPENQQTALAILQNKKNQISGEQDRLRKEKAYEDQGYNKNFASLDPSLQKELAKQKGSEKRFNEIVGNNQITSNGPVDQPLEQNQPINTQQQIPQQKSGIAALDDDKLIALTSVPGYSESAKAELKRRADERDLSERKLATKVKTHSGISNEVLKRADEIAENLPQKRSALRLMNDSIANKDLSFWSWDNISEKTGIEGLRSPEGALFKTAAKEYFLGNLSRAGSRPNQWIEQQIADMLTKIGRSTEANLSVSRALENELDLDQERVRLTSEISNQLEDKLGYVPRDIGKRVNDGLQKYADAKEKELFNDLRAIKSISEGKEQKFREVEKGTPVSKVVAKALLEKYKNDPKRAAEEAKKLGYSF